MNSLEFESLLEGVFPTWDRKASPNPGKLKVEMTGSGFLHGLDEKKADEIISLMKTRFPEDTAFFELSGIEHGARRLVEWVGGGTGSDLFYVIFASNEWQPVNEGSPISSVRLDEWLH